MEFGDAMREGDGNRVLRCWKYMVVIFSPSGNRNYACEAANLLTSYRSTTSQCPQDSQHRFCGVDL